MCIHHSHWKELFVLLRIPRLLILMEAYTLICAGKFRFKLWFFFVKNRFYGSRLYYVVKYCMNKLGNIHSITTLAHLFPLIYIKKKSLKIWKERVWGTKHISLFFIGPYIISTLWKIQGHYFIWQLKIPFLYLVSYTPTRTEKWMSLCDWL